MNAYLVMLRHTHDDVPLFLTVSRVEALELARNVTEEDGANECKIIGIDATTPCGVWVYTFDGARLAKAEQIQDWTYETPAGLAGIHGR